MYAWLGKDVVRQLRGMYAFAIWDRRTRELFCARDPFGIKPFFYALTAGGHRPRSGPQLRFASERKALADSGEVSAIDLDALRRYLSFQYVPAPATLVPPARSLPPGHVLIARPGGRVDVFRYWRPEFKPARSPSSASPEKILAALRDSVAVHLRSDVPVGAFLSGGVDSATLCAIAAESIPGLLTFTVGFEREGYSEIDVATATATALGLKSVPYVISPEEFVACLPRIVWHLDDPMADAAAVPLWFAAREARKHVKVVLSGEGADELFGGYGVYYQPGVVRAGKALPGWGRATISRVASELPAGRRGKGLLNRTSTPLPRRYIGNAHVFSTDEARMLVRGGTGSEFDVTDPVYRQAAEAGLDDVATMQLVDVNTWLPGDILVKADRMAMAHGLELRTPFLDREVLAVASRLARVEKTAAGTTKFALREAVGDLLPQAAAERAKLGFPVPLGHWLSGGMYGFAEQVVRTAQTGQWLNKAAAPELLRRFRAGDPGGELAAGVAAGRVLAVAPDLRGTRLRPGRAGLGARRRRVNPVSPYRVVCGNHVVRCASLRQRRRCRRALTRCGPARRSASGARWLGGHRAQPAGQQLLPDLAPAAVQPRHHRPDRRTHDLGDLPVGVSLDIGQVHRGPELAGQVAQGPQQVGVGGPVERLGLGGRHRRRQPVGGHLPFGQVAAEGLLRLAAPLAVHVDERGGQDPVQPGPQVGTRSELAERRVRLGRGLLDQVLGVGGVPGHPERRGVQLAKLRNDIALESRAVFARVFGSAHGSLRLLSSHCI